MWNRWTRADVTVDIASELRRQIERLFDEMEPSIYWQGTSPIFGEVRRDGTRQMPEMNLYDTGAALMVQANVPGVMDNDLTLTINQDVLSLSGERKIPNLEGYTVHRRERAAFKFHRSITLPSKVNVEKVTAKLLDGVLTIEMPKMEEAKPRKILVQA